ncbi:MAG: hypothetical protein AAGU74_03285 [Bacillota bacterium]
MFLNIVSTLYCALYLLAGYAVARVIFKEEAPHLRILFSGAIALALLMWLPALFSFLMGFTLAAQLLAGALCLIIGAVFYILGRKTAPDAARRTLRSYRAMLFTLAPLLLIGLYLYLTHTITTAADGSLHVGQSTYGDLSLHLGLVTSLKVQGFFPPSYSIYYGQAIGYPFLCDSISATFYTLGASLRYAMLLPSCIAYATVLLGVWSFFEGWLKKPSYTVLATLFFFVGGGFGFAYHFDQLKLFPDNISKIFTGFYLTPTNQPGIGLSWVNAIADMLVPQRATLFGWSLLFPCLTLLRRAVFDAPKNQKRDFIALGCFAGCLPLIHTHSFLALGMVSVVYFLRTVFRREHKQLAGLAVYGVIALALAAPQLFLFTFRQSEHFVRLHFNWTNETDTFLWFYIKNMGLLFLMLPVAYLMADKRDRGIYLGSLLIWIACETLLFQPNPYDNNKLLFIWFAFNCALVAKGLCELYARLGELRGRRLLAVMALCAVFLSGGLTLGREAVSDYELISAEQVEAAAYLEQNAPKDALILTAANHNNAVAVLTGRNIVLGTDSFLYFHGFDTTQRRRQVERMFANPAESLEELLKQFPLDYVYIGDYERYEFAVDEAYFAANYPVAYQNDEVTIYAISARSQQATNE